MTQLYFLLVNDLQHLQDIPNFGLILILFCSLLQHLELKEECNLIKTTTPAIIPYSVTFFQKGSTSLAYGDPVSSCVKVSPLILRKFKVGLPPSKKIIYLLQGNPLKMMKNAFCSILKTLFQIFNFFFASRFSFTNIYDPEDSRGRRALSTTYTCFTDTQTLTQRLLQRAHFSTQLAAGLDLETLVYRHKSLTAKFLP